MDSLKDGLQAHSPLFVHGCHMDFFYDLCPDGNPISLGEFIVQCCASRMGKRSRVFACVYDGHAGVLSGRQSAFIVTSYQFHRTLARPGEDISSGVELLDIELV